MATAILKVASFRAFLLGMILTCFVAFADAQISATERKSLFERSSAGDDNAITALTKIAIDGDAAAQTHLASMYEYGHGVKKDNTEATYWYRRAAEKGYDYAQNKLGLISCNMLAVLSSHAESENWRRKAAEQGRSVFQYALARDYESGNHCMPHDYKQAMQWYVKAAEQGDYRSQYAIGIMYAHHEGVPQDLIEEYKWFFLARAMADADADKDGFLSNAVNGASSKMTTAQLLLAKKAVTDWAANHPNWEWCSPLHLRPRQNCQK